LTERYADVILNISHESVDRPFTYIIPEDLRGKLTPGTAVQVPFGNAKEAKLGYVLSLRKEAPSGVSSHIDAKRLRTLYQRILNRTPPKWGEWESN